MKKILAVSLILLVITGCISFLSVQGVQEDGLLFSFSYPEKCSGVLSKKDSAVLEKVTEDGRAALKITPNPNSAETKLALDCYTLRYPVADIQYARYMTIEYKYVCPEELSNLGKMYTALSSGGGALKKSIYLYSEKTIKSGDWSIALFDVSSIKDNIDLTEGNMFKQLHVYPFGKEMVPSAMSTEQIMYISDISFYSVNPDPNAVYNVRFKSSIPDAEGFSPKALTVKAFTRYTLPECPYSSKNATFLGWRSSYDNALYPVGTEIIASDTNVIYTAEFFISEAEEKYKVLYLADYHGGSMDGRDNLRVSEEEFNGVRAVKCIPNPESQYSDKALTLDGYKYNKSGVDIGKYDYLVMSYYVDGELPKESSIRISITKNGGALTKAYTVSSTKKTRSGAWELAVFDLTEIDDCLNSELSEHMFKQMHIFPFYGSYCTDFTGNEAIYISSLMFFKEKPSLEIHESYMNGCENGVFRPGDNMTRAEACAVAARLLAGGDGKVTADGKVNFSDVTEDLWYYKYVSYLSSKGLLWSTDGMLYPDKAITRSELSTLLYRIYGLLQKGDAVLSEEDDGEEISFPSALSDTVTRAEAVTVINSLFGRSSGKADVSEDVKYFWYDVPRDFWGYGDISEATLSHIQSSEGWVISMTSSLSLISKDSLSIDFASGEAYLEELDGMMAERIEEIRSTSDEIEVSGTRYYVSENGNDDNDGKSPESAWKTPSRVHSARTKLKSGDGVFFERGGIYRGRFSTVSGVTYAAYGNGEKPKLYGSVENGTGADNWTLLDGTDNIWVYERELTDVGGIIINEGEIFGLKELPDMYDGEFYVRGSAKAKPFDIVTELSENHEFFSKVTDTSNLSTSTGKLYFRCDEGNPGELYQSIEFNVRGNIITNSNEENVRIDNLCLMYTGIHGIGSASTKNLVVTNCEVGFIGGSIHSYSNGKATRYGNGVEIFGSCDGYIIDNCYVYQCYDAGITHQKRYGNEDISMNNITYTNNVITDCVYNIEYFNGDSDNGKAVRDGENLYIGGNILRRAGYGWGNQRPDKHVSANIKSWEMRNEYEKGTYVIENNIFDRGSWKLLQTSAYYNAWCPIYRGNTYVQVIDAGLCEHKGLDLVYNADAEAVIKTDLGDTGASVYFLPTSFKHQGFLTRP